MNQDTKDDLFMLGFVALGFLVMLVVGFALGLKSANEDARGELNRAANTAETNQKLLLEQRDRMDYWEARLGIYSGNAPDG